MAELLGADLTFASGATRFEKGDSRVRGAYTIETKFTSKSSYSLSEGTWMKLEEAARKRGEIPLFTICFHQKGRTEMEDRVVVMPLSLWTELQRETSTLPEVPPACRSLSVSFDQCPQHVLFARSKHTLRLEQLTPGLAEGLSDYAHKIVGVT